jgi:hypothetical protein
MSTKGEDLKPVRKTSKGRIVSIFLTTIVLFVCSAGMCIAPSHISISGYPGADSEGKPERDCPRILKKGISCEHVSTFYTPDSPEEVINYFNDSGLIYNGDWVDGGGGQHYGFINTARPNMDRIGPVCFLATLMVRIDYVPDKREGVTIIQDLEITIGIPNAQVFYHC